MEPRPSNSRCVRRRRDHRAFLSSRLTASIGIGADPNPENPKPKKVSCYENFFQDEFDSNRCGHRSRILHQRESRRRSRYQARAVSITETGIHRNGDAAVSDKMPIMRRIVQACYHAGFEAEDENASGRRAWLHGMQNDHCADRRAESDRQGCEAT